MPKNVLTSMILNWVWQGQEYRPPPYNKHSLWPMSIIPPLCLFTPFSFSRCYPSLLFVFLVFISSCSFFLYSPSLLWLQIQLHTLLPVGCEEEGRKGKMRGWKGEGEIVGEKRRQAVKETPQQQTKVENDARGCVCVCVRVCAWNRGAGESNQKKNI